MGEEYTLAQEYQQLIVGLFREHLFSLEGINMETKEGVQETFVSKSEIIEKGVEILNELGKLMASDRRFYEIDSSENVPVSGEAEKAE